MKEIIINSKTNGVFRVIVDNSDFKKLQILGGKWCAVIKRGKPYFQKRFTGNYIKEMHRWIMGDPKGKYVDHVSGNTLDNRRSNLRVCTNAANLRNNRKTRPNNTSGKTGVWLDKQNSKWVAEIKVNYKKISLGRFKSFKDACKVRRKAEKTFFNF